MTLTTTSVWRDHTRAVPCPVCSKPDRCQYTEDGAHRCFRTTDAVPGFTLVKRCSDGTGIFRATSESKASSSVAVTRSPRKPAKEKSVDIDWATESQRLVDALTDERRTDLASLLGVTEESLNAIGCGWASRDELRRLKANGQGWHEAYPDCAWSFPERAGDGTVIGIAFRAPDGRKGAAAGGSRGLTIPQDVDRRQGPLLIVEGPSDVAAALTMGLNAIGRPSNRGGVEHLAVLVKNTEFIVVGENDARGVEGKGLVCPGAEGAQAVSAALAARFNKAIHVAMPPDAYKDVRAWLNARVPGASDAAACWAAGQELLKSLVAVQTEVHPPAPQVTIRIQRRPNQVKAQVTARIGDEVLAIDEFNPASSKARDAFAGAIIVKDRRLDRGEVERLLLQATSAHAPKPEKDVRPLTREELLEEHDRAIEEKLDNMPRDIIDRAHEMLRDPRVVNRIVSDIANIGVVGEQELALSVYMLGTSRLLKQPLSAIVQGTSSSGKSFTQNKVIELMPPEGVLRATDLTPMALYYMPPGSLLHRVVAAGERARHESDEYAVTKRALREMISSGELSKAMPIKINGQFQTVLLQQYGPIAFIESTTKVKVFDEDMNRCLPLATDESPEQTRRVMSAMADGARAAGNDDARTLEVHHAMQRMLQRVRVRISYARGIADAMPSDRPEGRRAIGHMFHVIQAVALLHQFQRVPAFPAHGDVIEATEQDYVIAHRLLAGPLGRALGGALTGAVTNLAKRLQKRYSQDEFSTSHAALHDGVITSRHKMSEYLNALEEAEVVELVRPRLGNQPAIWRIKGDVPEPGARWLPSVEALREEVECVMS